MMNFVSALRNLWTGRPRGNRRRSLQGFEALEQRVLLSGNVTARLLGGNLHLTGDSADNSVRLTVSGNDLVLTGLNGTRINGGTANLVLAAESIRFGGSIFADLGRGNDTLQIDGGGVIGGGIFVTDLRGTTKLGINETTVHGLVQVVSGNGADVVSLESATLHSSLIFHAGKGNNLLTLLNTALAGELIYTAGSGGDDLVVQDSTIGRSLHLDTGKGIDRIALRETRVEGNLNLLTGAQNDIVVLDAVTVLGQTFAPLGKGSDTLFVSGDSQFFGHFYAGGILGKADAFEAVSAAIFHRGLSTPGFEQSTVNQTLLTQQIVNGAETRAAVERSNLGGTPVAPLTLTVDTSENVLQTLSGETFTQQENYTITGVTLPGATVTAKGLSSTADDTGNYELVIPLSNGVNAIEVAVADRFGRSTTQSINVRSIQGTIVEYTTNLGNFQLELFDDAVQATVANFLSYLEAYEDSIIHRNAANPAVIQGGGAVLSGDTLQAVPTKAPIVNEFSANRPNVRGTISMARQADPNSATSQWFFNVQDNPALDVQGNQYAVFGRVIGTGMTVIDAIAALPVFDLSGLAAIPGVGLGTVPLVGYETFNVPLTGTVSVEEGSVNLTGVDTLFIAELTPGQQIRVGTLITSVASITSDTELVLGNVASTVQTDVGLFIAGPLQPAPENYVVISSINRILTA